MGSAMGSGDLSALLPSRAGTVVEHCDSDGARQAATAEPAANQGPVRTALSAGQAAAAPAGTGPTLLELAQGDGIAADLLSIPSGGAAMPGSPASHSRRPSGAPQAFGAAAPALATPSSPGGSPSRMATQAMAAERLMSVPSPVVSQMAGTAPPTVPAPCGTLPLTSLAELGAVVQASMSSVVGGLR